MKKLILLILIVVGIGAVVMLQDKDGVSGAEEAASVSSVSSAIVGHWQSTDDANSVVIFNDDGTTQDVYNGNDMGNGTWEVFEGEGFIQLRSVIDGEDYDYAVLDASEEYLSLSYMGRGNTLNYRRTE